RRNLGRQGPRIPVGLRRRRFDLAKRFGRRRRRLSGGGGGGCARANFSSLPQPREHGIDRDRVALFRQNLGHHASRGRPDFGVNFVGRNFQQRLVSLHRIADLLQPFNDSSLSNGLPHLRHQDISSHSSSPKLYRSFSINKTYWSY